MRKILFCFWLMYSPHLIADVESSINQLDRSVESLNQEIENENFRKKEAEDYLKRLDQSSEALTDSMNAIADKADIPLRTVTAHFWEEPWEHRTESWKERQTENWLFLGPTYWGYLSHNAGFREKLGFEAGVSMPWLKGIDLSIQWGTLFDEDRDYTTGYNLVLYLTDYKSGWFIGGTSVKDEAVEGFGSLGYQFQRLYIRVDMVRGERPAFQPIVAYGYKLRF
jgi:hypothetical protein